MRDTANFSIFGSVDPAEAQKPSSLQRASSCCNAAPLAAVLFAIGVGISVATGAVAALKSVHATGYGFLLAGNMEISGVPYLREVLW